jgi:aspartyl-tRNA(Asn)/glutamyl-tRNA(Gln) amidotransferase subunit C
MSLTQAEVEHVARLARLQLTPDELALMREQLSNILDYIAILQEVDVEGVPPTAQVTGLSSIFRSDAVALSLTREEALANAPDQQNGMFRVKAVFDD